MNFPERIPAEQYPLTHAFDAIAHPAVSAAAFEASGKVDAGGVHVTVMGSDFTLVNIWKHSELS